MHACMGNTVHNVEMGQHGKSFGQTSFRLLCKFLCKSFVRICISNNFDSARRFTFRTLIKHNNLFDGIKNLISVYRISNLPDLNIKGRFVDT